MAGLKPVYLISGDDDAKIDAWRARVRRRAEAEGGPGALEVFDARQSPPGAVVAELSALTFAEGTRYLLVDGIEAWKAGELAPLEQAAAAPPPDTVLVLVARGAAPKRLAKAAEKAGGEVREYAAPKARHLPRWASERAREEGLVLDSEAAKLLVARVGPRQARLVREIEKLAVALHPETHVRPDDLERHVAGEDSTQAWDLADAVVTGDGPGAFRHAEELAAQDNPPGRLVFQVVRRLREVHRAAALLDSGLPEQRVAAELKMPPWAAKRIVSQARSADREALEDALCAFADFECDTRGGGDLDEATAFSRALARATA